MNHKRTSAVRLSEFTDFLGPNPNARRSRVDGSGRSFIPRPSDRVSGVQPLETAGGSGLHAPHLPPSRHHSADAGRHTQHHVRPRAESAQRPTSQSRARSTFMMPRETPSQTRTPLVRAILQTPMSAAVRQSHPRTPSSERNRGRIPLLERAILALPGKDKRITSDIHWQKRTCERVVNYLLSHPVASGLMPNMSSPLRPITIKLFVDLVNCLLGLPNHINSANYINKLPLSAKRILYPGIMSKSWLKSVNAMHTYPNMLAFLAYLVDFAKIRDSLVEKITIERLCGVGKHGQSVQLRQNYYLQCWDLFQEQADPNFEIILQDYVEALKVYHEVSPHHVSELEKKRAELLHELNDPLITDAKNLEAALKDQPMIIEEKTRQLMHTRTELERKLKQAVNQTSQARVIVDTIKDHIKKLEQEIRDLHKCIEEQGMSVRQRNEIVAETERVLTAADSKRELIDDMLKMGYTKDLELADLQRQALIASNNMNKVLIAVGLVTGVNLIEYTLEERDLLAGSTLDSIRGRLNETLITIKKQGEARLEAARSNRETGVCRKQQILIQLESERQRMHTLRDELNALEERSAQMKSTAAEKLAKQRNLTQAARQRTIERRRRITQLSQEGAKELDFWQKQDEKWCQKLDQLRSEEELVRKTCESRAKLLIGQYINIAKSIKNQ